MIGESFTNKSNEPFKVTRRSGRNKSGAQLYEVLFLNTGFKRSVTKSQIKEGYIKDYYSPSVYGVGYLGNITKVGNEKKYSLWNNMLSRCYDKNSKDYMSYGGIGVSVIEEWLSFEFFCKSVVNVDGYDKDDFYDSKIVMDKDKKQQHIKHEHRIYSVDTCCFMPRDENQLYKDFDKYRRKFIAIAPSGERFEVSGLVEFAKENGLDSKTISKCLDGEYKQNKGWRFKEHQAV